MAANGTAAHVMGEGQDPLTSMASHGAAQPERGGAAGRLPLTRVRLRGR